MLRYPLPFRKDPILILGMHCSGTTLLAQIIDAFEVYLGRQLDPHLEAEFFMDLNDALLAELGQRWDRVDELEQVFIEPRRYQHSIDVARSAIRSRNFLQRYADRSLVLRKSWRRSFQWGWKDPRTMLLLPIWLRCYPQARIIFIVRNGLHVAYNLAERESKQRADIDPRFISAECREVGYAFSLWEHYHRLYLKNVATLPDSQVLTISFETLVSTPREELLRIGAFLERELTQAQRDAMSAKIDAPRARRFEQQPTKALQQQADESLIMQQFGYYA